MVIVWQFDATKTARKCQFLRPKPIVTGIPFAIPSRKKPHYTKSLIILERPGKSCSLIALPQEAHVKVSVIDSNRPVAQNSFYFVPNLPPGWFISHHFIRNFIYRTRFSRNGNAGINQSIKQGIPL